MKFDFDEIISRKDTNSLNYDGWRQYIFNAGKDAQFPFSDEEYIRLWVADMDFSTPPAVLNAIRKRLDAKILGYTRIYDDAFSEVINSWCQRQYNWEVDTAEMVVSPGIIPALNRLVPLLITKNEALLILTPSYTPFKKDRRLQQS
jgi:Bifunctional PLP-dependent enzyme with beta-cystathionase and maltose regulon repressor activities